MARKFKKSFAKRSKKIFKRTFKRKGRKRLTFKKKRTFKKRHAGHSKARSKIAIAKQMAAVLPDQVYLNNYADQVGVTGTTNTAADQIMWARQQVSSQTTSVQVRPMLLMPHDLNIMQQILAQQVTSVPPAGAGTATAVYELNTANAGAAGWLGVPTSQVLIKNWRVHGSFTNLETGPVELIHYRCKARRDLSGNPASGSTDIEGILRNGFDDTGVSAAPPTGVTAQVTSTIYGATPFMNPRFVANVQILKSKAYRLNPGKTIKLGYALKQPRLWKAEDFMFGSNPDGTGASVPTLRGALRGQHFSVFCLRGTFATDTSANAGYEIGVGNASVGMLMSHEVHYAVVSPSVMQATAMNAVPGFSAGAAGFPLPVMAVQSFNAINVATGARVAATTYANTIQDEVQTN